MFCFVSLRSVIKLFCVGGASAEEARAIREAVANASTLEEVERLNQMLRAGVVPGKATQGSSKNGNANGKFTSCLQLPCSVC